MLKLDALSLRDTNPDSILNFNRGVCLCTPKAIQIAEFCKDSRILNEDGGRAEKFESHILYLNKYIICKNPK